MIGKFYREAYLRTKERGGTTAASRAGEASDQRTDKTSRARVYTSTNDRNILGEPRGATYESPTDRKTYFYLTSSELTSAISEHRKAKQETGKNAITGKIDPANAV